MSLAGAAPSAQAARRHRAAPCSLSHSKTVLATRDSRLFTRDEHGQLSVYACLYSRNKRFLLSSAGDGVEDLGDTTSRPALEGSYVAYVLGHFDDSRRYDPTFMGFPDHVEAINLSTGAVLRFAAATGGAASARATDLVLAPDGSFAWIGSAGAGRYEVHRLNVGDAADAVIDSGPDVAPGSLALGGKTLYWTKAGKPVSAPLR